MFKGTFYLSILYLLHYGNVTVEWPVNILKHVVTFKKNLQMFSNIFQEKPNSENAVIIYSDSS